MQKNRILEQTFEIQLIRWTFKTEFRGIGWKNPAISCLHNYYHWRRASEGHVHWKSRGSCLVFYGK